jgi:hypothetical protein
MASFLDVNGYTPLQTKKEQHAIREINVLQRHPLLAGIDLPGGAVGYCCFEEMRVGSRRSAIKELAINANSPIVQQSNSPTVQ